MDSFYDAPRRSSILTVPNRTACYGGIDHRNNNDCHQITTVAPIVPEVSMIYNHNNGASTIPVLNDPANAPPLSHNITTAKRQMIIGGDTITNNNNNKENIYDYGGRSATGIYAVQQSFSRKQVRFESPQHASNVQPQSQTTNNNFNAIYMANIPKRHLDLSVIDKRPATLIVGDEEKRRMMIGDRQMTMSSSSNDDDGNKTASKEFVPKTYKEFRSHPNNNNNHCSPEQNVVTDILNYCHSTTTTNNNRLLSSSDNTKKIISSQPRRETNTVMKQQDKTCNYLHSMKTDAGYNYYPVKSRDNNINDPTISTLQQPNNNIVVVKPADNDNDEPTIKDLLKIIQQQNEQIMLLQKHVTTLTDQRLNNNNKDDKLRGTNDNHHNDNRYYPHPLIVNDDDDEKTMKKTNPIQSKFSIDLKTTSFEVSFRPQYHHHHHHQQQQQQQNHLAANRKYNHDFVHHQNSPTIQEIIIPEITDCSHNNNNDLSLHLHESLNVGNNGNDSNCPSPEPSIKIDMNQYDSSNDDDDDDDNGVAQDFSTDIGVTFYNNLMEQVNNMLKETTTQPAELSGKMNQKTIPNQTMNHVKEATLKHLRSIGVNLAPIDEKLPSSTEYELKETTNNNYYSPNDVSFAVKQLLMKYLPDEQLARITTTNTAGKSVENNNNNQLSNRGTNKNDFYSKRTDFSFASIEYMKKYNLIGGANHDANKNIHNNKKQFEMKQSKAISNNNKRQISKILDLNTLKLQPKLL